MPKHRIPTGDDCPRCGSEGYLLTDARQYGDGWRAYDGDPVVCEDCELKGWISADVDGAEVRWPDEWDEVDSGDDCPRDGDHESALASAYGPDDDGEERL